MNRDEINDQVSEMREWFDAYIAKGFTEDQAMRFLTRPFMVVNSSPEMSEMMTKTSRMLERLLEVEA